MLTETVNTACCLNKCKRKASINHDQVHCKTPKYTPFSIYSIRQLYSTVGMG